MLSTVRMSPEERRGECSFCLRGVHFEVHGCSWLTAVNEVLRLTVFECPACGRLNIRIAVGEKISSELGYDLAFDESTETVVWPRTQPRPVPQEVPINIAADYREAVLVLTLSPKASAALSRRCLQAVLRGAGYNQHDLVKQIDAALPNLPSHIATSIDAIRNIGNFAAHPGKDKTSGEIIDVEPGEAEWNLDVLDLLFDFYYVQPAIAQVKKEALNAKLQAAGKPPMK